MARVFLSHSSKDKEFVRRLATDLHDLGHEPWLDEWQIRVGDCIVSKIQEGLGDADYVVLVLTPEAVASGWVEREWKDAYWSEIAENRIIVLPVLLRSCELPTLIRTKKYADFTRRYELGLAQLTQAILPPQLEGAFSGLQQQAAPSARVTDLLARVQVRREPLAQLVAEALTLAHQLKSADLADFCAGELAGWEELRTSTDAHEARSYRSFPIYISSGYLNPRFAGWGESASNIFSYMETHPEEFFPHRSIDWRPLGQLEAQANEALPDPKSYLHWTQPLSDVNLDADTPEARVHCYARATSYQTLLDAVRAELTKRLVRLLPSVASTT
jgi:hypothetical protein